MKLVTFRTAKTSPRVGQWHGDHVTAVAWPDPMHEIIRRGVIPSPTSEHYPLAEVTLLPPLRPGKIIAVGRNYADHAAELGNDMPQSPLLFSKLTSAVIGQGAPIQWRASVTQQVDWEGELAVVIGKRARYVREDEALGYVFGYTIANDVSARDLQKSEPQWLRAKGLDTFCPLGPAIVTRGDIPNPHALHIRTRVNDEVMQDADTDLMFFKIPYLIAYCSQMFTLEAGDVLLTGTPAGVGSGLKPPRFLKDGDIVSVTIEPIGTLTNPCQQLMD